MRIRHNSGDHGGSDDVVLEIMEIQAFTIFINRFHYNLHRFKCSLCSMIWYSAFIYWYQSSLVFNAQRISGENFKLVNRFGQEYHVTRDVTVDAISYM